MTNYCTAKFLGTAKRANSSRPMDANKTGLILHCWYKDKMLFYMKGKAKEERISQAVHKLKEKSRTHKTLCKLKSNRSVINIVRDTDG